MNSNVFSISEEVIVSEQNFTRLNSWLRENGFTVEEVDYTTKFSKEDLEKYSLGKDEIIPVVYK